MSKGQVALLATVSAVLSAFIGWTTSGSVAVLCVASLVAVGAVLAFDGGPIAYNRIEPFRVQTGSGYAWVWTDTLGQRHRIDQRDVDRLTRLEADGVT